ncbi:MAG: hypothetical protein VR68_14630 [Peptococcaceae bacterium BRH_c4a]|nr:MAG: hypothetical protein VR68_14630 [Peptococcaceae bacterium BRH_c4a]
MLNTGRNGIIFDFDDTLVENAVFFEISRKKFVLFMEGLGFHSEEVLVTLDRIDIENVTKCGAFLKECFPGAMAQTYDHFCAVNDILPRPDLRREALDIGWWVFRQKPVPVKGSKDVLEELGRRYDLFLATKGDPTVQWQRIEDSGLKGYFRQIYVLKNKTRQEYVDIAQKNNFSEKNSWVIGNSIKSDINPGIQAGLNCIHIPNRYTWHFEMEEPVGEYLTLDSLGLVPDLLLRRELFGIHPHSRFFKYGL